MFCSNCGCESSINERFCGKCGSILDKMPFEFDMKKVKEIENKRKIYADEEEFKKHLFD